MFRAVFLEEEIQSMAEFLRYDHLSVDDLVSALVLHHKDPAHCFFPAARRLRAFRIEGPLRTRREGTRESPLILYFVNEPNLVTEQTESFFLLLTDPDAYRELVTLCQRFRHDLKGLGFASLLRIDPKYGLVQGSAKEPVDPLVKWDKNHILVTLYLTDDPKHPAVALGDYVQRDHQVRYGQLFEKYNQCKPAASTLLGFDLSRWRKGKKEAAPLAGPNFHYRHLQKLAELLQGKYYQGEMLCSLLFEDVTEEELDRIPLDQDKAAFLAADQAPFFASIDELLK